MADPTTSTGDTGAPLTRDDLSLLFREAEKPETRHRIGVEEEKFGVHEQSGRPLAYDGPFGVRVVMEQMAAGYGWEPVREREGGPLIALTRGDENITLEPGAQLELSGAPHRTLHELRAERDRHFRELEPTSRALGIAWLSTGFHPLARLDELPWVPKQRYPIMKRYLPTRGGVGRRSAAHDMMQRTATVQANYDYCSERDALDKLTVTLKLAPLVHALFANAPFEEGRLAGRLSERGDVWLHMDPARSGLIPSLWKNSTPTYDDYVEWALDAGMFLFWRAGAPIENTGQTFRDFLEHGYAGHHATLADWRLHLGTLFPEARLKTTIEVRLLDALPQELALSALALWTGLFYDQQALRAAADLTRTFDFDAWTAARPRLVAEGLHAPIPGDSDGFRLARAILDLAHAGLERRAASLPGCASEAPWLAPAYDLVERRKSPAEDAIEHARRSGSLISATRNPLSPPAASD